MQCGVSGMSQMRDAEVLPCHWEQRIMCLQGRGAQGGGVSWCATVFQQREMEHLNWRHQITMQLKPLIMRRVLSNSPHHKVGWLVPALIHHRMEVFKTEHENVQRSQVSAEQVSQTQMASTAVVLKPSLSFHTYDYMRETYDQLADRRGKQAGFIDGLA